VVDLGGNWIRIGKPIKIPPNAEEAALEKAGSTRLVRATHAATLLSDAALAQDEPALTVHRVHALVFRAGLAINIGGCQRARKLLTEMRQTPLNYGERDKLSIKLQRADDLAHVFQG
jgi:hypothetical protein